MSSQTFKQLNIGGWEFLSDTKRGVYPVFTMSIKSRIKKKKAVNVVVTGEAGEGKSYQGWSFGRVWDKRFDIPQIVFTFKEFMQLVSPKPKGLDLGMGRCIVFDEPSYAMSKRDWYKEINKALVLTIESFRFKIHPLIIPIINMNLLDKSVRSYLIQYMVLMIDRGRGFVYRLKPKQHEEGYYRYHLCDIEYQMLDIGKCNKDSCLGCRKLQKCNIFRARYERKKKEIQDTRYESSLLEFSEKESQELSDQALDMMLLSIANKIVNDKGIPDSDRIQIALLEDFQVKIGRNRSYRLRKRLITLYPDKFPLILQN